MNHWHAFGIGCAIGIIILMTWLLNTDGDWE